MNWIKTSDAMPEPGRMCISDDVLVTVSNIPDDFHVVRTDRYDAHSKTWETHNPEHDRAMVTAWMPFPKPYQPPCRCKRVLRVGDSCLLCGKIKTDNAEGQSHGTR